MPKDKYSAVWVSHSSISDFLTCPRSYYLKNIYKDPKTGNKIQIITPPLSLGQTVHKVIESLSVLPTDKRFETPLVEKFDIEWKKISGKRGGFTDKDTEAKYKRRGEEMLRRVTRNPGPLMNLAVKIQMDLPHYWLSEEDEIILCGKIDWIEYFPETEDVHIIDFKTGKTEESRNSLQLPIYSLLVHNCQKRPVQKVSYWHIAINDTPTKQTLPDLEKSHKEILKVAKKIKLARQLESFTCPHGDGCRACLPLEKILKGEGELVGKDSMGKDTYILTESTKNNDPDSIIL